MMVCECVYLCDVKRMNVNRVCVCVWVCECVRVRVRVRVCVWVWEVEGFGRPEERKWHLTWVKDIGGTHTWKQTQSRIINTQFFLLHTHTRTHTHTHTRTAVDMRLLSVWLKPGKTLRLDFTDPVSKNCQASCIKSPQLTSHQISFIYISKIPKHIAAVGFTICAVNKEKLIAILRENDGRILRRSHTCNRLGM